MRQVAFRDLHLIDYAEAWDLQKRLFQGTIDRKLANRNLPEDQRTLTGDYLLFCEHPHVYTLGKSGKQSHLLLNEQDLREAGVQFFPIDRGGDITYHGPGQIVGYPIFDLDHHFTDIHRFLRTLEEAVIGTLEAFNIKAGRIEGLTGVWLDEKDPAKARKICAFGIRASRWVTMHGFAFNVNTDLSYFDHIVPCGIADKGVTCMAKELGGLVDIEDVKRRLKLELADLFDVAMLG
ncbi:MAG: lipoyl(octanoyl) transferase LipB [Flavobacteriales bacterium]|nr:lipoyl(octanoyl) transferase LipB [Flavobacteriales bacterium]MBK7268166.1 lipoyl(octanoyl) transferase LipB [Flavobacteriales bacterium]MBK7751179.1 lipoyl(octanoyl) transferase LipB [Flavobacteriales bacterium]MBK9073521.1 lipoyl(octanoyl) transferase LipB [Flavobacteriales bacterium]MBK9539205.1 lipoyl(octanoyl) transferase LipB [Flavobacteriales bacterium]